MKSLLTNTLKNGRLPQIYNAMLKHFEENQFVTKNGLGFNGQMIQENLKHEWILSNLIRADEPTFLVKNGEENDISEAYRMVAKLPFSVVSFKKVQNTIDRNENEFLFESDAMTVMEKKTFCLPSMATAFFHKQQRERRIWWRKFSSLPGRFSTSEVSAAESGNVSIDIIAEYEWCKETVENITHRRDDNEIQVKEGRNLDPAHTVSTEVNLHCATCVYLCDAYDPINEENGREMMRIHRKLAPNKITFAVLGSNSTITQDLGDLALVLARKLRQLGISCLLTAEKRTLESSFSRADAMGIPYTLILTDRTLQDGMLGLRSRDTTLQEQSHVGIVVPYIEKIMKNY